MTGPQPGETTAAAEPLTSESQRVRVQPSRFALVVYSGHGVHVTELLEGRVLTLGRGLRAGLQVDDPKVSRQHLRVELQGGQVAVEDLGSRNGTWLQGQRIHRTTWLPGTQLDLGSARLVLAKSTRAHDAEKQREKHVIGDPAMVELYDLAARYARVDMPALILGETGTGKEHLAHTLHRLSARADRPMRAINCGAIPATLTESTLFGHERGAFTGALKRVPGVFQEADGGIVFLDEVGELSTGAQASLLRVLETGRVRRVGASTEDEVDVRVVAATHCDLETMVEQGRFRRDLYYRLNPITLKVPPLRERLGDLPALVDGFITSARRQWGVDVTDIEPSALRRLAEYKWPGNVRQLRNVIERACLTASGETLRELDLPNGPAVTQLRPAQGVRGPDGEPPALRSQVKNYEADAIASALARSGGNRKAAAQLLDLPMRTFFRKLKEHKLSNEQDV